MIVIQRRLFWKIYLTLMASLVAVAVLMGAFWSLVGEDGRPRWGAFHLQVDERLIPERDSPPGAIAAAMKRLGDEMDADISVYDADGSLVAAQAAPIAAEVRPGPITRFMSRPRLRRNYGWKSNACVPRGRRQTRLRLRFLQRAQSDRASLPENEEIPRYRHTLRQARNQLPRRRPIGRRRPPTQLTTGPNNAL